MNELQALVIKDEQGNIKRIVRTYETSRRAEEDRALLADTGLPEGQRAEVIEVDHIDD